MVKNLGLILLLLCNFRSPDLQQLLGDFFQQFFLFLKPEKKSPLGGPTRPLSRTLYLKTSYL